MGCGAFQDADRFRLVWTRQILAILGRMGVGPRAVGDQFYALGVLQWMM